MELKYEARELRDVYVDTLIEMTNDDSNVVVVDADLGKSTNMFRYYKAHPSNAFNVGIAEANAVGVAAGLSAMGKIPFVTSFTAFVTRRAYDTIAVSCAYAGLTVKLVGIDPGIMAGSNGGTHMSIEDLSIMRAMPTVTVFEAVDSVQLKKALPVIKDLPGVTYLRINRKKNIQIFDDSYVFDLYKADVLREGTDIALVASGIMVGRALKVADILAQEGIQARVIAVHTIKPLDEETIVSAAQETGAIVTMENSNIVGGLGGAVAECVTQKCPVPVLRVGIRDRFGEVGDEAYLEKEFFMDAETTIQCVKDALAMKKSLRLY